MSAIDKQYMTTYTSTLDGGSSTPTGVPPLERNAKLAPTPSYYIGKYKGIEAFDVCMDFARDSYNIGVAIAYLLRAGKKLDNPMVNDLHKAIDHIQKEIEYLENDEYGYESNNGTDLTKDHFPK
jgi:hypothetical protein